MKIIILIFFVFCKVQADSVFFSYPAEKNISKLSPISMLYDLNSDNSVKLNENKIFINAITARLIGKNNSKRIRFNWPKGLLSDGEFIALDSAKKFLFKFKPSVSGQNSKSSSYQNDLELNTEDFSTLKKMPFFNICIQKATNEGTIRLCTQESFMKVLNKTIGFSSRSDLQSNPSVEINGNLAGLQGEILLTTSAESINIKLLSTQKSFIELDLTAPKFDILEINSLDSENYKIKARGPLPVNVNATVLEKTTSTWNATIPKTMNSIYILSNLGLNYKALLPKLNSEENFSVPKTTVLSGNSYTSDKSSELVFRLDDKYSASLTDTRNQTLNTKNGLWYWKINNIEPGLNNYDIKFSNPDTDWTANVQIERLKKHHMSILIGLPPWLQADYRLDWSDRWVSMIQLQRQFTSQATGPLNQQIVIDTKFKVYPSYFMTHPTFAAGLYFSLNNYSYEGNNYNVQVLGVSADTQLKNNLIFAKTLPWFKSIILVPISSTGDLKVKNSIQLQATLSTANKFGFNYDLGFETQMAQYELTDLPNKQILNLVLVGGISKSF